MPQGEVDVAKLRRAFERSGLSKSELARRMGWMNPRIQAVNQTLGYSADPSHNGEPRGKKRQKVCYDLAVRLVAAMNADPFECDV